MPDPIDPAGPARSSGADPGDPALDARLAHLAPTVDPDEATVAFGRRRAARARRRRAVLGGGLAAAVVVIAGIAAVLAAPGDDGQRVLTGSTTEAPAATTTTAGYVEGEVQTVTDAPGLSMAMITPRTATVGERLWVDVTVTNERSEPVLLGAVARCNEPVSALAGTIEAVNAVQADTGYTAFSVLPPVGAALDDPRWSGDLAQLPDVLSAPQMSKVYAGREESQLATTSTVCADMVLPPTELAPGGSLTRRIAIDLRWDDAGPVDGQTLDVLASTGPITGPDGTDIGKLVVRQPVTLEDPLDRWPSYDAATQAAGLSAAPTLAEWVDETLALDPGLEQRYSASTTWWQGAWESWIVPSEGSGHQRDPLRIRFDADQMAVTDVRTVFGDNAPSDDPDQPDPLPEPVDAVRYQAD